jgi:hypothetical protein
MLPLTNPATLNADMVLLSRIRRVQLMIINPIITVKLEISARLKHFSYSGLQYFNKM